MQRPLSRAGIALLTLSLGSALAPAPAPQPQAKPRPKKTVLVELFTSQGWDLCPSAEQLLGQLAETYGPDRVVPIAFHVDYFNDPWRDPYSQKRFSEREYRYSAIYDRENGLNNPNYLYLTPLMMFDGRAPMLGSDDPQRQHKALPRAKENLSRLLAERPTVDLKLEFEPAEDAAAAQTARKKTLRAEVTPLEPSLAGRQLLVEVVVWEDPVTTKVGSGELAGKTYAGRYAARTFAAQPIRLANGKQPRTATFPLELEAAWGPARCGVAAFVQDEETGRVFQAALLRWEGRNQVR